VSLLYYHFTDIPLIDIHQNLLRFEMRCTLCVRSYKHNLVIQCVESWTFRTSSGWCSQTQTKRLFWSHRLPVYNPPIVCHEQTHCQLVVSWWQAINHQLCLDHSKQLKVLKDGHLWKYFISQRMDGQILFPDNLFTLLTSVWLHDVKWHVFCSPFHFLLYGHLYFFCSLFTYLVGFYQLFCWSLPLLFLLFQCNWGIFLQLSVAFLSPGHFKTRFPRVFLCRICTTVCRLYEKNLSNRYSVLSWPLSAPLASKNV